MVNQIINPKEVPMFLTTINFSLRRFALLFLIPLLYTANGQDWPTHIDVATLDCPIEIDITSTTTTCEGADVCLAISGGTPPYTFTLNGQDENNPATGLNLCFQDLQPGAYTLTVTDAEGCSQSIDFNIPFVDYFFDANVTDVSCFGGSDGAIHLEILIDLAPLFYSWEGPNGYSEFLQDVEIIENLQAGEYSVSITTVDNACVGIGSWIVEEPDPLNIEVAISTPACGQPDVCVFVNGGTPPYQVWAFRQLPDVLADSPHGQLGALTDLNTANAIPLFQTASNAAFCAQNVPNGTYYIFALDANFCYVWEIITIDANHTLERTISSSHVSCYGAGDGSICFAIHSGTPPYVTTLSPNTSNLVIPGPEGCFNHLGPGQYVITSTDATGCSVSETVFIHEPDELNARFEITSPPCSGQVNGCLMVEGGTMPFRVYVWEWPDPNNDVLPAVDFTSAGPVIVDANPVDYILFHGDPVAPYIRCADDIPPGFYLILVVDANGCYTLLPVHIPDSSGLETSFEITSSDCDSGVSGCLTIEGGTPPYRIWVWHWDSSVDVVPIVEFDANGNPYVLGADLADDIHFGANTSSVYTRCADNIPPGDYLVLTVDANGCYDLLPVRIPDVNQLEARFEITSSPCSDQVDGCLYVNGGTSPYQIWVWRWPNPSSDVLPAVQFNDDGTPAIDQAIPTDEVDFNVDPNSPDFLRCAQNIPAGHYLVLVVDANGCYILLPVHIPEANPLETSFEITSSDCADGVSGCLNVEGGTPPYRIWVWTWNSPLTVIPNVQFADDGTPFIEDAQLTDAMHFGPNNSDVFRRCADNIPPGNYLVLTVDANGCYDLLPVHIPDVNPLEANFEITSSACADQVDGCLNVNGGTTPYQIWVWHWPNPTTDVLPAVHFDDNGNPQIDQATPTDAIDFVADPTTPNYEICAEDIPAGYYLVLVVDANGCYVLLPVIIPEPNALGLHVMSRDVSCFGEEDGVIKLTILGGEPPYTVSINGITVSTSDDQVIIFENLAPGTYVIDVFDANQCAGTVTVVIHEPDPLDIELDFDPYGSYACAEPIGGVAPYHYRWFDLSANAVISNEACVENLNVGIYLIVVADAHDCQTAELLFIDEQPCLGGEASVDPEEIQSGETTTLTLSNYSGTSIQWQFKTDVTPWINIPGATTDVYQTLPINTGTDKIILVRAAVICQNGDVLYSTETEFKVEGSNLLIPYNSLAEDSRLFDPSFRHQELKQLAAIGFDKKDIIRVYPTLSSDLVYVQFEEEQMEPVTITLMNSVGQAIYTQVLGQVYQGERFEISVQEVPNGVYFVQFSNDLRQTERIVVNR